MTTQELIRDLESRLQKYEAVTEGLKRQWPYWRQAARKTMAFREGVAAGMRSELETLRRAS
jgi:hypothetical protein